MVVFAFNFRCEHKQKIQVTLKKKKGRRTGFRLAFVFRAISFNCLEADFKFFIADTSSRLPFVVFLFCKETWTHCRGSCLAGLQVKASWGQGT